MVARQQVSRVLLDRTVAAAYGVLLVLYFVRHVRLQPLQIPAYLLIVAYDLVEVALPAIAPYHPIGFPLFLYALAVVAASVTRWTRRDDASTDWPRAAGAVSLVVAALSFLFAAIVGGPLVSPTDNPTPLAITGTTGLVLAAAGWWLLVGRSG